MKIPTIRPARLADAPMLARLHVQSWEETYPGLLPRSEIAARGYDVRLAQWQGQIDGGASRIVLCEGLGFAQMGPQRDPAMARAGWPEELYCLYLLQVAQRRGIGRALLRAVAGDAPFTAIVLADNAPACAFYAGVGGRALDRRPDHVGAVEVQELVFGFGVRGPAPDPEVPPPDRPCI